MANRGGSTGGFFGALGDSMSDIGEDIDARKKLKAQEDYQNRSLGLQEKADQRQQDDFDRKKTQDDEDKRNMGIARDTMPYASHAMATGDLNPLIERLNTHSDVTGRTFGAAKNADGTYAITIAGADGAEPKTFNMDAKGAVNALSAQIPYSRALQEQIVAKQAMVPLEDEARGKEQANKKELVGIQEEGATTRTQMSNDTAIKTTGMNNSTSLGVAAGNNATSVQVANIGADAALGGAKIRAAQGVDENGNPIKGQDTVASHREAVGKALDRYAQKQDQYGTMSGTPLLDVKARQDYADIQAMLPTPPRGADPEKVAASIKEIRARAVEKGNAIDLSGVSVTEKQDPEAIKQLRYKKGLELVLTDMGVLKPRGNLGGGLGRSH